MGCIQKAIEPFAVPEHAQAQARSERSCDPNQRVHGNSVGVPRFDPADD